MRATQVNVAEIPSVRSIIKSAAQEIKKISGIDVYLNISFIRKEDKLRNDILLLQLIIARYYKISWDQVISKNRAYPFVNARHAFMYIANTILKMSSAKIAREVAVKDHTTVLHGIKKIEGFYDVGDPAINDIENIKEIFQNARDKN